jgi:hypothetical protein
MTTPEAEHRAAVALALEMADADAAWGDYGLALRWLDASEALDGGLPPAYVVKRRYWKARLAS